MFFGDSEIPGGRFRHGLRQWLQLPPPVPRAEIVPRGLMDEQGNVLQRRIYAEPIQEEIAEGAVAGLSIVIKGQELEFPAPRVSGACVGGAGELSL